MTLSVDEFWGWSLAQYESPQLQEKLLQLQDKHGLVVLELLLAIWLGTKGVSWVAGQSAALHEEIDPWLAEVVVPLRAVRKRWKGLEPLMHARAELLKLEVSAERSLAELIFRWLNGLDSGILAGSEDSDWRQIAIGNLHGVVADKVDLPLGEELEALLLGLSHS